MNSDPYKYSLNRQKVMDLDNNKPISQNQKNAQSSDRALSPQVKKLLIEFKKKTIIIFNQQISILQNQKELAKMISSKSTQININFNVTQIQIQVNRNQYTPYEKESVRLQESLIQLQENQYKMQVKIAQQNHEDNKKIAQQNHEDNKNILNQLCLNQQKNHEDNKKILNQLCLNQQKNNEDAKRFQEDFLKIYKETRETKPIIKSIAERVHVGVKPSSEVSHILCAAKRISNSQTGIKSSPTLITLPDDTNYNLAQRIQVSNQSSKTSFKQSNNLK